MTSTEATQRLGIGEPIVQGPFGGGFSSERLAATVSELGGLGSFGAHHLSPDELVTTVRGLRARTSKPFAINLWLSQCDVGGDTPALHHERAAGIFAPYFAELGLAVPEPPPFVGHRAEDQIEALLGAAPPAFSFVFGVPAPAVLAACKQRGIVSIGAATSIAEGRALDEAGVDVIVATGMEAGGHRPSFLARAEDSLMGTMTLVPLVADRVRAPVIAAGGIVEARGVRAAMTLGAGAAQVGTAFLACEESNAPPAHRELLFSERAHATTLTRAFTGRLARGIVNRWTTELGPRVAELPPYPITSWYASQLRTAALGRGDTELVSLWSGQGAPNLRHRTATALFHSLLD